jgi:hypothetical protein
MALLRADRPVLLCHLAWAMSASKRALCQTRRQKSQIISCSRRSCVGLPCDRLYDSKATSHGTSHISSAESRVAERYEACDFVALSDANTV